MKLNLQHFAALGVSFCGLAKAYDMVCDDQAGMDLVAFQRQLLNSFDTTAPGVKVKFSNDPDVDAPSSTRLGAQDGFELYAEISNALTEGPGGTSYKASTTATYDQITAGLMDFLRDCYDANGYTSARGSTTASNQGDVIVGIREIV